MTPVHIPLRISQSALGRTWCLWQWFSREIAFQVYVSQDCSPVARTLTTPAQDDGINGTALIVNNTNSYLIAQDSVVILSCDPSAYPGFTDATNIWDTAVQAQATAIILYSLYSDFCSIEGSTGDYEAYFSMESANDTRLLMDNVRSLAADTSTSSGQVELTLEAHETNNGTTSTTTSGTSHHSGTSSTAVAMVVLYAITGVITALFLVIILTGAVRAHRHPERYGPRNVVGRPRQSRARGMARAVLESLPIVKVGEPEAAPKPTDVELGDTASTPSREHPETEAMENRTSSEARGLPQEDVGIAPAASALSLGTSPQAETNVLGCSICTEDFEVGQDQRVLPCDHRFHPACVDPWLLNVSGTCPLCRIDLRPAGSDETTEGEVDGNGNPRANSDGQALPPPLPVDGDARRTGLRRSIALGIMGIARPDRLTREERIQALRQYHSQLAANLETERANAAEQGTPNAALEETSLRARFRNALRIRTRRTGEESVPPTAQPPAANPAP